MPAQNDVKQIFGEAISKASREEREAFLANACSHDPELRQQVDSLLLAHAECRDFLSTTSPSIGEGPGTVIGRYKILQQIGEGGFGIVFMAEQQEPVRRMVALKIIKAGMDTREVIARFEAERQALALMDHSNIARVLDGGATESGRPYFVMDLVKGVPITEFCDQRRLSTEARLRLFMQVCAAVHHAHQKGIIHRDLKPTNVLVTLHDGEAVPKVIDFGISKAIGQRLTEKTLFTRFEQLMGTPSYMSPEQAEWSGLDIDTRSDIYSLGVLLYELLTGTTPLEKETVSRAALDEIRRLIREQEPERPSHRLSRITHNRNLNPNRNLPSSLPSFPSVPKSAIRISNSAIDPDLDWIILKSLEKDRTRRYETVNALARDLEHHLQGEVVTARPPSIRYRSLKFVQKHRFGVAVASAITISLSIGLVLALIGFVHARRESQRATRQASIATAVNDFLSKDVLGQANPFANSHAADATIREVLDRAAASIKDQFSADPLVEAAVQFTLGSSYRSLEEVKKARTHLERATQIRTQIFGRDHPETLHAREELALASSDDSPESLEKTRALLLELATAYTAVLGSSDPATLNCQNDLAVILMNAGRSMEAEEILRDISARHPVFRPAEEQTAIARGRLAGLLFQWGHLSDAIALGEEMLKSGRRSRGWHSTELLGGLSLAYFQLGDYATALERRKDEIALCQSTFGSTHSKTDFAVTWLAHEQGAAGQWGMCLNTELGRLTNHAVLNMFDYLRAITTALILGDTNTYRLFAEKMFVQFRDKTNSPESTTCFVIASSLRPELLANPQSAFDQAALLHEPWRLLSNEHIAKGMAAYRRSDFSGALHFFEGWRNVQGNVHGSLRALVAGTFTALIQFQQGDSVAAKQCLREVDELCNSILGTGELGQDWVFYAISAIFRREAEHLIFGREVLPIADAISLEQARARWSPVRRHLNEGDRLAISKQWIAAREEYVAAMQNPIFDWRTAERSHPELNSVLTSRIGVTFALAKDFAQFEKLFVRAFALSEVISPDPVYAMQVLRTFLAVEQNTATALFRNAENWATTLFQSSRGVSTESLALIRTMLAYRLGNYDKVLEEAKIEGKLSVRSAGQIFRAMAFAKRGRAEEGRQELAHAEAILIKPLKHLTGDFWWDLGMCELLLDEARETVK